MAPGPSNPASPDSLPPVPPHSVAPCPPTRRCSLHYVETETRRTPVMTVSTSSHHFSGGEMVLRLWSRTSCGRAFHLFAEKHSRRNCTDEPRRKRAFRLSRPRLPRGSGVSIRRGLVLNDGPHARVTRATPDLGTGAHVLVFHWGRLNLAAAFRSFFHRHPSRFHLGGEGVATQEASPRSILRPSPRARLRRDSSDAASRRPGPVSA